MCMTCAVWTAVLWVASCILGESILSQRQKKKPLGAPEFVVYHRPHTLRVCSLVTQSELKMKNLSSPKKKPLQKTTAGQEYETWDEFLFLLYFKVLTAWGRDYKNNGGCADTSEKPMYNPNMKSRTLKRGSTQGSYIPFSGAILRPRQWYTTKMINMWQAVIFLHCRIHWQYY